MLKLFRSAFLIMWKTNHSRTSSGMPIASVESIFLIWFPRSAATVAGKNGRVSSLNFNNVLRISGLTRLISPSPTLQCTDVVAPITVRATMCYTHIYLLIICCLCTKLAPACYKYHVQILWNMWEMLCSAHYSLFGIFYIFLTSCLLHLTGIAFLTADAAAIICGNEAIRLASHSSARREPIQRMWAKKNCKIWPGIIQHELRSTLFFIAGSLRSCESSSSILRPGAVGRYPLVVRARQAFWKRLYIRRPRWTQEGARQEKGLLAYIYI